MDKRYQCLNCKREFTFRYEYCPICGSIDIISIVVEEEKLFCPYCKSDQICGIFFIEIIQCFKCNDCRGKFKFNTKTNEILKETWD